MVIHTPHLEMVIPDIPHIQEHYVHEYESAQEPEDTSQSVFAQILAGLSGREVSNDRQAVQDGDSPGAEHLLTAIDGFDGEQLAVLESIDDADIGLFPADIMSQFFPADEVQVVRFSPEDQNNVSAVDRLSDELIDESTGLTLETGDSEAARLHAARSETAVRHTHDQAAGDIEKQPAHSVTVAALGRSEGIDESRGQDRSEGIGQNRGQGLGQEGRSESLTESPHMTNEKTRIRAADAVNAGESAPDEGLQVRQQVVSEHGEQGRAAQMRSRRRGSSSEAARTTYQHTEAVHRDGSAGLRPEARMSVEGAIKEVNLELRLPNQGQNASAATTSWEVKAGHAFEDMLARELHQNFNNDIVRHASAILKEGSQGIIKLALMPESLGNVKIRLEMAENKITGIIIVESEEALRAFEKEVASLEKAFRDSGFAGADLEMSLASNGQEAQQQWQGMESTRTLPWQYAASRYDDAIERMELPLLLDLYWQGAKAINVIA